MFCELEEKSEKQFLAFPNKLYSEKIHKIWTNLVLKSLDYLNVINCAIKVSYVIKSMSYT